MSFLEDFTSVPMAGSKMFKPIKVGNNELLHCAIFFPLTRTRALYDGNIPNSELAAGYYG